MTKKEENTDKNRKSRKNYPGDLREAGTKDYGLILSNLMNYRNQLFRVTDDQEVGKLFIKISEKLKELGYERPSKSVKQKAGRRKLGKFKDITEKKKEDVIEMAVKYWELGKEKHEAVKEDKKQEELKAKKEELKAKKNAMKQEKKRAKEGEKLNA